MDAPHLSPDPQDDQDEQPQQPQERKKRAKTETPEALDAYQRYEALAPRLRSHPTVAVQLKGAFPDRYSGSIKTITRRVEQWAHDHNWRDRVKAYDREKETARREQVEKAARDMNDDQATIARNMGAIVAIRIRELLELDAPVIDAAKQAQQYLKQNKAVPQHVKLLLKTRPSLSVGARTLGEWWRGFVELERLARGEATEIAQQTLAGGVNLTIMAATGDGKEANSPFGQDPNELLMQEAAAMKARTDAEAADGSDGSDDPDDPTDPPLG